MTNPRKRQLDRAVRAYQREHPGTTLEEARRAVAADSGRQQGLPARIPAAPMPRPAESLAGYVQRVAAAVGVQRHRAMELLGLEPGTSATQRLDELTAHLPDRTVRALRAATGMTAAQARGLTAPSTAATTKATDREALTRHLLDSKMVLPGGKGKTRTEGPALARLLAAETQRPLLIDTEPPRSLDWPGPALTHTVLIDLPWLADGQTPPADPELVDEILKELGITPGPQGRPAE
ncbi:TniQ family protein [Streptomyces sp. XH2]|uniref:TniQ family protein n=1 Tax=Streptomyces sp. XH2 TaxID=3412483 RepID=UPI003C7A7985